MTPDAPCDRVEEYLDDVLPADERAAMERHLASCEACRAAVEEYRRLRRLALSVPPVEIPDDLSFRIRRRLAGATMPERKPSRRPRWPVFALGAPAAAAAVLLVAFLLAPQEEVPAPETRDDPVARVRSAPAPDLLAAVADWLVQAGNAEDGDGARLLAEARELRLLRRVRAALSEDPSGDRGGYLTAVSDLLVQLENDPGAGFLTEEARLVAMVSPKARPR